MPTRLPDPEPLGLYLHIPFCRALCSYCDFYKRVGGGAADRRIFLTALHREIAGTARQLPEAERRIDSIYLGGGTPSLLTGTDWARLRRWIGESFRVAPDCETTLEVNPEVPFRRLPAYRRAGANRISIGLQALDRHVLAAVGRRHDAARAIDCLRAARHAGFDNRNVDLIAGLPGQDLAALPGALQPVLDQEPDHLSLYLLETDKETRLVRDLRSGRRQQPPEAAIVGGYHGVRRLLQRAGYDHYEISNFCRPGRRSRHNMKYWTDRPFLGCGPGAHGYLYGDRYRRPADLDAWQADPVARLPQPPAGAGDPVDRRRRAEEAAFLGLRLRGGIDLAAIDARYRVDLAATCAYALDRCRDAGLLNRHGRRLRLTVRGLLLANEAFAALLESRPARRSA